MGVGRASRRRRLVLPVFRFFLPPPPSYAVTVVRWGFPSGGVLTPNIIILRVRARALSSFFVVFTLVVIRLVSLLGRRVVRRNLFSRGYEDRAISRLASRTLPGGEFDWGGTSTKR